MPAINGFEDYVDIQLHLRKGHGDEDRHGFPSGPPQGGPGGTLTNLPNGTIGYWIAPDGKMHGPVLSGVTGASLPKLDVAEIPVSAVIHPRLVTVDSEAGT